MIKWQTKKFEDCLDKVVYTNKVQRKDFLESGAFPVISQEVEAINGYWNNKKDLFKVKTPVVIFGDHTKILKYINFDFVLGADGVKILQPKKILDPKYFYYYLQSVELKSLGYARHYKLLKEIEIYYPESLPEQRRIVKILDEVFANIAKAKANTEKNLQNSRELFESYSDDIFTKPGKNWEEKKLGDFYEITSSKRVFKSEWKEAGVPFYRAREIVKLARQGYVENELYISDEMYNRYSEKYGIPKTGDIMVTGVGTLGICYVVKENDKFYFKDGNIIWLKRNGDIDSRFVEYAFKSNFLKKQINNSAGATVGTFTIIKAKNTNIPVPPLTEQKDIVKKLDALAGETKKLEAIYRQKLVDLEELKKSILKKAFSGEL